MASGPFYVGDIPAEDLTIATTRDGVSADLTGFESATAVIVDPDGVTLEDLPTAIINGSNIIFTWPDAWAFPEEGVYTLIVTIETEAGDHETVDPVLVEVYSVPVPTGTWCSRAFVLQTTRVDVTEADISSAEGIISLLSGRDLTNPAVFLAKDYRNIRYAIAWQAAHLNTHPSVMTDFAVTSSAVGDVSVSYDTATGAGWLAPLSRLALGRVSWRQNRTVTLGHLRNKVHVDPHYEIDDELYAQFPWRGLS